MSGTRGWSSKAGVLGAAVVLGVAIIVMSVGGNVATAAKPQPPRFVDNGDGTITDTQTGLMWEQKTGTVGDAILCSTATTCADPTNVNNIYTWSSSGSDADGMLFTDFLAKMNCTVLQVFGRCGPGIYRDWRIPTLAELRTILTAGCPQTSPPPCIDPIFEPTGVAYWSSSSVADAFAWDLRSDIGLRNTGFKTDPNFARAMRGGP